MHKGDKLFVAVPSDENRASKNISGLQRNIAYDQFNDARNNSIVKKIKYHSKCSMSLHITSFLNGCSARNC